VSSDVSFLDAGRAADDQADDSGGAERGRIADFDADGQGDRVYFVAGAGATGVSPVRAGDPVSDDRRGDAAAELGAVHVSVSAGRFRGGTGDGDFSEAFQGSNRSSRR